MKDLIIILVINLLVYSLAFGVGHLEHQDVKIYFVFLAIQALALLLQFRGHRGSGSDDAMGAGMARGFFHIYCLGLQMITIFLVFIIFIVRQINVALPIQLMIIVAIVILWYLYTRTDYKIILTSWLSTNEKDLTLRGGIMYTNKDKPFTGTSIFQGKVETYPSVVTAQGPDGKEYTTENGVRTTQYQNGVKEGAEKLYYTTVGFIFHSQKSGLHSVTHYHQGQKHGVEIINYNVGCRNIEAQYVNGLLHGLYKEYYWLDKCYKRNKKIRNNIGPLKLEMEYKNGVSSGIYRTYSEFGALDEDYIIENGIIVSGRKKMVFRGDNRDRFTCWEFYENGQLQRTETYRFSYGEPPDKTRYPLDSEVIYENGEIIEEWVYNYRNQKVKELRVRVDGVLVEVFNNKTGVDRIAEFGY